MILAKATPFSSIVINKAETKKLSWISAVAARAIWKGSISFGLVNIPIQVFSATQKEEYTSFNQLCDNGHKIKYKKWCPVEGREVPWSEIKKGYEITSSDYVVLEKEEIENIKLKQLTQ